MAGSGASDSEKGPIADAASGPGSDGMRVEVVTELGAHADAWDAIVAEDPTASPFTAGWWVRSFAGADARIVLVFDDDRLTGGVPLQVRRWFGVSVLGILGEPPAAPDLVDVVARPSDRRRVCAALAGWFAAQPQLVVARGLRADADLIDCLGPSTRAMSWSSAPVLALDPDVEPTPRSSRVANTVRRSRRRIARSHGYVHRVVDRTSDPAEADRALADLLRLHRVRWPDGSNFTASFDRLRPALRAGVAAGAVSLHEAVGDDAVLATMVVFDQGRRRCYYQSGRDLSHEVLGVGSVLMADVVRDGWSRGFAAFEFLRGREAYKLDWCDAEQPLVEVVHGRGVPWRLAAGVVAVHRRGRRAGRDLRDRVHAFRGSRRPATRPVR